MSQPLQGEHLCKDHQGNHSHYAEHSCTICNLQKKVARQAKRILMLETMLNAHYGKLGTSPDANVEAVRSQLLKRSQVGLEKYGVTTERQDVDLMGWLQHLQEELLDASVYVEATKKRMENAGLSKTEGDDRNV